MEKPTTRSVRVLRAFLAGGKLHKVDAVVELDLHLAAEMRNANKVEYVDALQASRAKDTPEQQAKTAKSAIGPT